MTAAEQIISELDARTQSLAISQLIGELQVLVERISFAAASQDVRNMSKDDVELLFEGQLSAEILDFVGWLVDNKLVAAVIGDTGRLFLNHCIKRYHHIQQVHFTTALTLPEEVKQHIACTIMPSYPAGARILFEVDPSIIAGFRINDRSRVVDKTMRAAATQLTRRHLQEVLNG
jgi:F0F1-type ATP synthase delta subunit